MEKAQSQVLDFMVKAGQCSPKLKPAAPSEKIRILRIKLLLEEVFELAVASGVKISATGLNEETPGVEVASINLVGDILRYETNEFVDLKEVADALSDIKYVNEGAAVAYGLDLEPFFEEVHRSNMTKWWKLDELDQRPDGATVTSLGEGLHCVRNADGKVLKSPSYEPANLAPILAAQQG